MQYEQLAPSVATQEEVGIVTGIIIRWLVSLPEGLFATETQLRGLLAAQTDAHAIDAVLATMAPPYRATLEYLVQHWRRVCSKATHNKMHVVNVATCVFFSLTNLNSKPSMGPMDWVRGLAPVTTIIESSDLIFADDASTVEPTAAVVTPSMIVHADPETPKIHQDPSTPSHDPVDLRREMTEAENRELIKDMERVEEEQGLKKDALVSVVQEMAEAFHRNAFIVKTRKGVETIVHNSGAGLAKVGNATGEGIGNFVDLFQHEDSPLRLS